MKEERIEIRADEGFVEKVDYLKRINGFKNRSDTVRKVVEKEWRKEHGCISCPYAYMVKDSENSHHTECGITHKILTHEDLVLNPIDCPRWMEKEKDK